ncbi:hypothetical protein MC885_017544 [Smutsia gigantea]|nr:hypothetical protein MC885_017544 [Smutsia gigantea]
MALLPWGPPRPL